MGVYSELEVGADTVHLVGNDVTIFALRAMPDWTVREFCHVPIFFQGRKFYLRRKTAGPAPYAFHYVLSPWQPELGAESSRTISYDEAYVAFRDEQFRAERKLEGINPALMCLYPFLGFTWSRFKEKKLGPMGFEPVSITEASIFLALGFFLLEGVFVLGFHMGFLALIFSKVWLLWVDYALLVLLPADCIMRYDQVLSGKESPGGFLEWAVRALVGKRAS